MSARVLTVATGAVLALLLVLRFEDPLAMWRGEVLIVELDRFGDPELSEGIEGGIGVWLQQLGQAARPDRVGYRDRSPGPGLARVHWKGRAATISHAPGREQLEPVFDRLAALIGPPPGMVLVATDWAVDRRFVRAVRAAAEDRGWPAPVMVAAAREPEQGSPAIAAGPGDWVVVATEAARAHMEPVLRSSGRKILAVPPYPSALEGSHPSLWFIAPWDPSVEYFSGGESSSCAAAAEMGLDERNWPMDGLVLRTLGALAQVQGGDTSPPPLTLVGPPESWLRDPRRARRPPPPTRYRSVELPPCDRG